MALPPLTPEERALALAKAAANRKQRAEVKAQLKAGEIGLPDVFQLAEEIEAIGKTRVIELLESLPGVGRVRAERLMEQCEVARSRRVRGLGVHQREALLRAYHGPQR